MKHRILIEFSADTLPDDFLDQIAGRVYGHPAVEKKECIAAFVGDVLKDAERYMRICEQDFKDRQWVDGFAEFKKARDAAIDAAKDTQ